MTDPKLEGLFQRTLPRHVAIIMDGNGRWASQRRYPRFAGHQAGVEAARGVIRACGEKGIEALTLFAFSSENWRRPPQEVNLLMGLLLRVLQREVKKLKAHNVHLRIIGERGAFSPEIQRWMARAEEQTRQCTGLKLVIAVNYGGRWDLTQAARALAREVAEGRLSPEEVDQEALASHLSLADLPEPDLFIRTGGEMRISNFLLWQLAYTELYFTDTLWPDFDEAAFEKALASFARRQRRFGHTGEQVEAMKKASRA
ncbi:MAG: isoprenyl transferase [Gammaproteobacteria bacterium]|nr:MAG: isoprenyl transferase [Gammaproteobacteria bacterium]